VKMDSYLPWAVLLEKSPLCAEQGNFPENLRRLARPRTDRPAEVK
jgi:hypothetical protein